MKRIIKFRFWSPLEKRFVGSPRIWCRIDGIIDVEHNHGDIIPQQFTGLRDNNGKEIYEGDILEINYSAGHERDSTYDIYGKFQVILKNGEWKAVGENLWGDDEEYSVWGETTDYAIKKGVKTEIIGNIFENSELLNNK